MFLLNMDVLNILLGVGVGGLVYLLGEFVLNKICGNIEMEETISLKTKSPRVIIADLEDLAGWICSEGTLPFIITNDNFRFEEQVVAVVKLLSEIKSDGIKTKHKGYPFKNKIKFTMN